MAIELPYLPSNKNVGTLFDKIASAKVPDALTQTYLGNTIGLKGSNDRYLIGLLKKMDFLDNNGKPTAKYSLLKNKATAKIAIANGIRHAYKSLFDANEDVYAVDSDALKGIIAQVAGTDDTQTRIISYTFLALVKTADFSSTFPEREGDAEDDVELDRSNDLEKNNSKKLENLKTLRNDFHFNIQVHLPSNGTEETYLNIFNALRKTF